MFRLETISPPLLKNCQYAFVIYVTYVTFWFHFTQNLNLHQPLWTQIVIEHQT